jgi:hypothetical protein
LLISAAFDYRSAGNKVAILRHNRLGARGSIGEAGTIFMIGSERFIRREIVFSVVAHGCLLLGLLLAGAGGVRSVPPEAMTVEIVPPSEAPQTETNVDGTTLESKSSGSEVSSDSDKGSATAERPRPKAALPSLQEAQASSKPLPKAGPAAAQPQATPPAQPDPHPVTQPDASEPLLPPTTPTDQPQQHPDKVADQPKASEMFAMPLALPGERLGSGFDAPAPNPAMLPHDDIAAFRARLSLCSQLPKGIDESAAIAVRISFKRDGTLASTPELLEASLSADAAALLQVAINALQRCQPFTELPADKYRKWKTLDLVVTPMALSGR